MPAQADSALAEVLLRHQQDPLGGCVCNGRLFELDSDADDLAWVAHVKAELAAAGIVAVQLPEPTDTYNHHTDMPMMGWEINHGPVYVDAIPGGEIRVEFDGSSALLTDAEEAPAFAAALLAAAVAVRPANLVP